MLRQLQTTQYNDENPIVNGNMSVHQRVNPVSVPTSGTAYTLDQWRCTQGGSTGGVASVSQVDLGPGTYGSFPNEYGFRYALYWTQSVAGTGGVPQIDQLVDGGISLFDGIWVTLSFWAASTVNTTIGVYINQWTGTSILANTTVRNYALTANIWRKIVYPVLMPPIPNGTVLGASQNTAICIRPQANTVQGFLMTGVQLERGREATPFKYETPGTTLRRCERFYQKSFTQGTAPAQAVQTGRVLFPYATNNLSGGYWSVPFRTQMRAAPTITYYNPLAANAFPYNYFTGRATPSATSVNTSTTATTGFDFNYGVPAGWVVGDLCGIQWTATAEL